VTVFHVSVLNDVRSFSLHTDVAFLYAQFVLDIS